MTGLDLQGDATPRSIPLGSIPANRRSDLEFSLSDVRLLRSADSRYLAAIVAARDGANWITRAYPVDLSAGRAGPPIDLFSFPIELRDLLATDARPAANGAHIFVSQNAVHYPENVQESTTWTTEVRVIDLAAGKVERALEVPGALATRQLSRAGILSPDGRRLLLQELLDGPGSPGGVRVVALDTAQLDIVYSRQRDFQSGDMIACRASVWRITASGRYLYAYCPRPGLRRADPGTFRFIDAETGEVVYDLPSGLHPFDEMSVLLLPSPDGRWLYAADPISREVAVLDLEHPAIVHSTTLPAAKPGSFNLWRWLSAQIVQVAEAKMELEPGLVLSPDGSRLYLVDRSGPEDGDGNGVWAIDTASLQAIGHWLDGQDISGLQVSRDGRELYAANPTGGSISVVDTAAGAPRQTLRAIPEPIGFVDLP